MKRQLSVVMITKNSDRYLEESLASVKRITQDIIIVDGYSTDNTLKIAAKHKAKILLSRQENLGQKKAEGLAKIKTEWALILDSDEILTGELQNEVLSVIGSQTKYRAFRIPYQNHFLSRPVNYGGEDYKMIRLFKKKEVRIEPRLVHENVNIEAKYVGKLKHRLNHYSYQSLGQMFRKFTDYALREARAKQAKGERTSLKKIFLYPPHMFYARFVESQGYKDGLFRIPLDLGFAYMELLTYLALAYYNMKHK